MDSCTTYNDFLPHHACWKFCPLSIFLMRYSSSNQNAPSHDFNPQNKCEALEMYSISERPPWRAAAYIYYSNKLFVQVSWQCPLSHSCCKRLFKTHAELIRLFSLSHIHSYSPSSYSPNHPPQCPSLPCTLSALSSRHWLHGAVGRTRRQNAIQDDQKQSILFPQHLFLLDDANFTHHFRIVSELLHTSQIFLLTVWIILSANDDSLFSQSVTPCYANYDSLRPSSLSLDLNMPTSCSGKDNFMPKPFCLLYLPPWD